MISASNSKYVRFIERDESTEDKCQESLFTLSLNQKIRYYWYKLEHSLVLKIVKDNSTQRRIFKYHTSLIPTFNIAKKADIIHYVINRIVDTSHRFDEIACLFGLLFPAKCVTIKPVSRGRCFGGLVYFCQQILNKSIQIALNIFKNGMPIQAAMYQAYYDKVEYRVHYQMQNILFEIVDKYLNTFSKDALFTKLKKKWKKEINQESLMIFNAVKKFLESGKNPKKDNLLESVTDYMQERKKRLGIFYGTIRAVAEKYLGVDLTSLDRERFVFSLAGLNLKVVSYNVPPQTIKDKIPSLTDGLYHISLPIYNHIGKKSGDHCTGLVVDNKSYYFFDPNFAIGEFDEKNKLSNVAHQTVKTYTGLSLGEKRISSPKKIRKYISNFLKRKPNTPRKGINTGFSIYKITKAE